MKVNINLGNWYISLNALLVIWQGYQLLYSWYINCYLGIHHEGEHKLGELVYQFECIVSNLAGVSIVI